MSEASGRRAAASDLRRALADYVKAVHSAYLSAARERDADVDALPLSSEPFTVAIVAADQLHLVATRDRLPAMQPHEQPIDDEVGPVRWQVRFLDATVVPELGDATAEIQTDVLALLGVSDALYHLLVRTAGSLDSHQAMHAGTGLGNAHARGPT